MNTISFMGANLVAQQLNWSMTEGWMQGDHAANSYYAPIDTFPERFEGFVGLAVGAGFDTVDVWTGQLNWTWATAEHLDAARAILERYNVAVVSYAGTFGETSEQFARACQVAKALGARILGGNTGLIVSDRAGLIAGLNAHDVVLAIENHPEKSSAELLAKIGTDGHGRIGAAVDTGWWGTQGYDAAKAIRELSRQIMHVHLKDVRAQGAHETCAFGEGIVDIKACVEALKEIGYSGPISIEHEPEHFDPMADIVLSRDRLRSWSAEL
jgi:sugar phosphate isomerase/epimerase